jgi:hypothetical protein
LKYSRFSFTPLYYRKLIILWTILLVLFKFFFTFYYWATFLYWNHNLFFLKQGKNSLQSLQRHSGQGWQLCLAFRLWNYLLRSVAALYVGLRWVQPLFKFPAATLTTPPSHSNKLWCVWTAWFSCTL